MFDIVLARLKQGYRTMDYPSGAPPAMPTRFVGRPVVDSSRMGTVLDTGTVPLVCPTGALSASPTTNKLQLDTGKCLFCRNCTAGPNSPVTFTADYQLAARRREELFVADTANAACQASTPETPHSTLDTRRSALPSARHELAATLFKRSLRLRQVSAGGCNACEADTNVLGTVGWDLGRFGIQFVASPRHADGLLITGPVTQNMKLALEKTWQAVPGPKIVIAVGSCAIDGGPYIGHPEICGGADKVLPVDLYIPGCPPHPLTILDGLLRMLGVI